MTSAWWTSRSIMAAAIVDRLTFGGNIIETGTDSYRLRATHARHQAAGS
jgi:hypothetical protein